MNRISTRDKQIVAFTVRNQLSTNEILQQCLFEGQSHNAVTRVTARLCELEWLTSYPLHYPAKYMVPGKRTVAAYGLRPSRVRPLGPQSLPTEYAVLEYVAGAGSRVERLTSEEISARWAWYQPAWLESAHCQRDADNVVELIRVDLGGKPDHVARKCRSDIARRFEELRFRSILEAGEFRLTVLTCTTYKASAIQNSLSAHRWPGGLSFHIAVIRNLIPLLPNYSGD